MALAVALVCCISCYASTKILNGNFECLRGESEIAFVFNFSKAVYKKKYPLKEFILKANRADNWEKRSLEYFMYAFNYENAQSGIKADTIAAKARYELVFNVLAVDGGGTIKGVVFLKDRESGQPVTAIKFSSGDSDSNDEVTFRDQMDSLGKEFGRLVAADIKKANKQK